MERRGAQWAHADPRRTIPIVLTNSKPRRLGLIGFGLAGLCLLGCGRASDPAPRHLVLVSVDTLRADRLGSYGYARPTSPAIDALAASGVLFEHASTPSPWTLPAHASLFTGHWPARHGVKGHREGLPAGIATLAERLSAAGFETAAAVNSHHLTDRYGLHRGFDELAYVRESLAAREPSPVLDAVLDWLAMPQRGERPFFLFVHLYDVHSDYASLPDYEGRFVGQEPAVADGTTAQLLAFRRGEVALGPADAGRLSDLYDAGVAQLDDGVARLRDRLASLGLLDETLLVLTSDHGEEFLEHGGVLHGRTHYEELVRIPLIFSGPGLPEGLRVTTLASLVDVVPTVLAVFGLPPAEDVDGIDLSALWSGSEGDPGRVVFYGADHNNRVDDAKRAARRGAFKLLHDRSDGSYALHDLARDPGETRDVSDLHPDVRRALEARIEAYLSLERDAARLAPLGPEEAERLRALGYLE